MFMETWMGGGLGRAQGGYDEMVFRAMVRDDAHFYDPLGLVSRGVRVDFQIGANAYLYGTRFFTWLAYVYSPEKVIAWIRRDEGSDRYYADQFQQVFGIPLEQAWQDWIAFEHEFQRRNLAEVRKFPVTPHRKLAATAMGSISRMYYDEATGMLYAAFRYPGVVEHVGALNTRDGSIRRLADIKRAMLYKVASFAYDPDSGTVFLHQRQPCAARPDGGRRQDRRGADAARTCADRRDRLQPGRSLADGRAPRRTASQSLVRIPYPYNEWKAVYTFPYESVPYDLDISPDGRLLSGIDERGQRRPVPARVGARQDPQGRRQTLSRVPLRAVRSRRASCSPRTDATCMAAAITPACPTSSATRSPPARSRRFRTRKPAFSARCRSPTDGW